MKKYFITGDLEKTLIGGVDFSKGEKFEIPSEFRDELIKIINSSFDNEKVTEFIKYNDIKEYFLNLNKPEEFIISLDDGIYIDNADFYFSSTRTYRDKNSIVKNPNNYSILQRNGLDLSFQDIELMKYIKNTGKKEVILCDDGLFSGDTLKGVISNLKTAGIEIKEIRTVLNFTKNTNLDGIPIVSMQKNDNYIDWLDERDLFYGTMNGGASFFKGNSLNGLSYISSLEIASKKASIPENKSEEFCNSMFDLNKEVWKEIENNKGKIVRLANLPRIQYLFDDYDRNLSIREVLELENKKIILN